MTSVVGGMHIVARKLKFNGTFSTIRLYHALKSCSLVCVLGKNAPWESCTSPIQ